MWLAVTASVITFLVTLAATELVETGSSPVAAAPAPELAFEDAGIDVPTLSSRCDRALDTARSEADAVRATAPASIEELLMRINKIDVALGFQSFASLLSEVHPDEQMRDAATNCDLVIDQFATALFLDRSFYERAAAFSTAAAADRLAQRRYEKLLEGFERSGIGLATAELRDRAQSISDEITELSTNFSHKLASDTRSFSCAADDADMLAGLDPAFVAAHTSDGVVTITTDYPDTTHVFKYGRSATLRRTMYGLARSRGAPENLATLQRVLELRWEWAQLLGWPHYASYATATKMIGTAQHADAFTRGVANITAAAAEEELERLRRLKRAEIGLADGAHVEIEAFDHSYYATQLRAREYALNATELSRYFRYDNAREGVLRTAARLFHLRFERRAGVPTWHEAVEVYDVHWAGGGGSGGNGDGDAGGGGGPIGRIYLDMHPRQDKYKHAAQFTVRDGVEGVQLPEGALVTNFPAEGPMEHSQVTTFFHEFGHLMHHVVGGQGQRWKLFSGVATEWDFVEAPSQMLEEWALDEETLRSFATHDATGAPIPRELIAALRRADVFGRAISTRQQMYYAQVSLQLHMRDPTTPGFDTEAVAAELAAAFSPYPPVGGFTHFVANFGHLMGYSAIYYTYMWSEAIAQAMLQPFKRAGFYDPGTSLRYRDLVLRPGGALPAASLLYTFLGEPPSLDALHRWLRGEE